MSYHATRTPRGRSPLGVLVFWCLLALLLYPSGAGATELDYAVRVNGAAERFFPAAGAPGTGFSVTNEELPLWSEYQRLSGAELLGLPVSHRYPCDESVCQAFQHGILKWRPEAARAEVLRILDWLHVHGKDDRLEERWGIPPIKRDQNVDKRLREALDKHPALRAYLQRLPPAAQDVLGEVRAVDASRKRAIIRTASAIIEQSEGGKPTIRDLSEVYLSTNVLPAGAAEPAAAPPRAPGVTPVRIAIASLEISAPVVAMDLADDGSLPVPLTAREVAWYRYGAHPGERGNAVLAGHVDWNGQPGSFRHLGRLAPGAVIGIAGEDGVVSEYQVEWVVQVPDGAAEGLAAIQPNDGPATLTLVTCGGRFDLATREYLDRIVVRARAT